ncbi:hypothetical protein Csa_021277 [Cucumis sativus]|nr:hypothetical protein Csa_021277 [Cucumis sativus]
MSKNCMEIERRILRLLHGHKSRTHLTQIHAHFLRHGLHQSNQILAHFISVCASFNRIAYADRLFSQSHNPNIFLFNSIIKAHSLSVPFHQSLLLFSSMKNHRIVPDQYTFAPLLKSCANLCEYSLAQNRRDVEALELFQQMEEHGFKPDEVTVVTMLPVCSRLGALEVGQRIHSYASSKGNLSKRRLIRGSRVEKNKEELCVLVNEVDHKKKEMEMRGIDPRTSRMLSERSTI